MRSFEVHPETGRDADTFRVVIAPPRSHEDEGEDDAPSKWPFAVSILIGALVGLLVIAKTYAEDHPTMPVAARTSVAAAAPAKVVAPPAETKVSGNDPVVATAPILQAPQMITPEPPKRAKNRSKK